MDVLGFYDIPLKVIRSLPDKDLTPQRWWQDFAMCAAEVPIQYVGTVFWYAGGEEMRRLGLELELERPDAGRSSGDLLLPPVRSGDKSGGPILRPRAITQSHARPPEMEGTRVGHDNGYRKVACTR